VASDLKRSLKRLGLHPDTVRRAAIATYEAEMNVIIYAREGTVNVSVDPETISIVVRDKGRASRTSRRPWSPASPRRRTGCGSWVSAPAWACPTSRAAPAAWTSPPRWATGRR